MTRSAAMGLELVLRYGRDLDRSVKIELLGI